VGVAQADSYTVSPSVARVDGQGFASDKRDRIFLELDGKPLTEFVFGADFTTGKQWWSDYKPLPAKTVRLLPAGTSCRLSSMPGRSSSAGWSSQESHEDVFFRL
jgi:hypothetical protein